MCALYLPSCRALAPETLGPSSCRRCWPHERLSASVFLFSPLSTLFFQSNSPSFCLFRVFRLFLETPDYLVHPSDSWSLRPPPFSDHLEGWLRSLYPCRWERGIGGSRPRELAPVGGGRRGQHRRAVQGLARSKLVICFVSRLVICLVPRLTTLLTRRLTTLRTTRRTSWEAEGFVTRRTRRPSVRATFHRMCSSSSCERVIVALSRRRSRGPTRSAPTFPRSVVSTTRALSARKQLSASCRRSRCRCRNHIS